ncbi:MAG: DUF4293 family protein [Chitinophagaceae bacterium]|nr:DUF4293 family protein [Chitinophagaceae bacterium]
MPAGSFNFRCDSRTLYFSVEQIDNIHTGTFSILPFIIVISYYMAFQNIRKDEKLVKSLDKLR